MGKRKKPGLFPNQPQKLKPWSAETKNKTGRSFNSQMQGAIYSLYKFMKEEADNKGPMIPLSQVRNRVARALEISTRSVTKYVNIGRSGADFDTPGKKRPRKKVKRDVHESIKNDIRNTIYELCKQQTEIFLLMDREKRFAEFYTILALPTNVVMAFITLSKGRIL
ncbi:uncharacterized protein LOC123273626 [Cotesia glomerata]|uniref:uncharacterized protein LOC123273626 n=1 Tax=Cotesia glomerata TaxID=32391 RepID=UPI001D02FC5E|nr:uncharacterized protein LOC123273626 [Cotesia glomerata]